MWWFIPAIVAALVIGALTLSLVADWFNSHKTSASSYGTLVKERMKNGNFRIVAGIFDHHGTRTATKEWEAQELDNRLKDAFGSSDHIQVKL